MQSVLDAHVRSMAAFEARVTRFAQVRNKATIDAHKHLESAQTTEVCCGPSSLRTFGCAICLLVVVVASSLAFGTLLLHRHVHGQLGPDDAAAVRMAGATEAAAAAGAAAYANQTSSTGARSLALGERAGGT
jgi:hypothetical protein